MQDFLKPDFSVDNFFIEQNVKVKIGFRFGFTCESISITDLFPSALDPATGEDHA